MYNTQLCPKGNDNNRTSTNHLNSAVNADDRSTHDQRRTLCVGLGGRDGGIDCGQIVARILDAQHLLFFFVLCVFCFENEHIVKNNSMQKLYN